MLQNLKKKSEGFTIIEVLIVLAIAGLIMLIVFLAVPALQRNQRNTSRRNDVGRIGSIASEFVTNNNGTLPSSAAHAEQIEKAAGSLSQYSDSSNNADYLTIATGGTPAPVTDVDTMRLVTGRKCGTNGAVTATGANSRNMALQYAVESGNSGTTSVCQEV